MDLLIVGNGGREQALATKLSESDEVENIYIAQGNSGTEFIDKAENVDINPLDIGGLAKFALQKRIGLSVIGPDDPLAHGIVDEFADRGLSAFGPTKAQARVEWDRDFAKGIDAPRGGYGHFDSSEGTLDYAMQSVRLWPLFVKDNYLAQGKGATRCNNLDEVEVLLNGFSKANFFKKGRTVVIEDFVDGQEGSHHAFCDGKSYLSFPFIVRDHKSLLEGGNGPMTGGMGVYGPLDMYSPEDADGLGHSFVAPVVRELGFKGALFSGLKGNKGEEKNLEWNARFGDAETQVYMRLLKSDLLPILMACVEGKLDSLEPPDWHLGKYVVCLVMAAPGYPIESQKGGVIEGIEDASLLEGVSIIHAGTKKVGSNIKVAGGRVLNVIAESRSLDIAVKNAYAATERISSTPALQVRQDIGRSY